MQQRSKLIELMRLDEFSPKRAIFREFVSAIIYKNPIYQSILYSKVTKFNNFGAKNAYFHGKNALFSRKNAVFS